MKILFVTEHFYPHVGGGEKLFFDLAKSLKNRGEIVKIATSNSGGKSGEHRLEDLDIISFKWPNLFGHPVPTIKSLENEIEWADVVFTTIFTAGPIAQRVSARHRKPCILISYEYIGSKWFTITNPFLATVFLVFEKYVYHRDYSSYIAISKSTKRDMISNGIKANKITQIYPVFNNFSYWREKNKEIQKKEKVFLYYGRPGKTKGVFVLIKSIIYLKENLPKNVEFHFVVSDDPIAERKKLEKAVQKNNLSDIVKIMSSLPQDDLREKIRSSFCVIIPSITEGFGYSAYQASLMKKRIIISDAGSLPEVVSGKCIIFKNKDSKNLANAISRATKDEFDIFTDEVKGNNTKKVVELYTKLLR